ncbi:MAG: hypothetical protein Q9223_001451 [Gallowayella weberi]
MFLIEDNRKAILYTGDIRGKRGLALWICFLLIVSQAEPWWVSSVSRQPTAIPYTHGIRRLDRIYLDTTFAVNKDPYRNFPTKAQGLSELLGEVSKFPKNTILHFNAWTLGYEEVWVALAAHLKSQIHVDDYKLRLYSSLVSSSSSTSLSGEGAALCGFPFGNRHQAGCLTNNDSVRLHSCELGTRCSTIEASKNTIWITPLINRSEKGDIPEVGAGGGGGDLTQMHELELTDSQAGPKLIELCKDQIRDDAILSQTIRRVENALCSNKRTVALSSINDSLKDGVMPLGSIASFLIRDVNQKDRPEHQEGFSAPPFDELNPERVQNTLEATPGNTKSVDVYPCVTDEKSWTPEISIETLFGHLCTGNRFSHDLEMQFVHGCARAPESSPRRNSSKKASNAAPQSSSCGSESSKDSIKSPLASEQPDSALANVSGMEYSSARSVKRRATGEISRHRTSRVKLQGSSQGYSARHEKCVLSRSFSGWLSPVGRESLAADRTFSESSKGRHVNSTPKGEQTSLSPLRVPFNPKSGVPKESQSRRTCKLQGESSHLNASHQGLPHNNGKSCPASTTDENLSTKNNLRKSSASTPSRPLELSATFASKTEADADQDGTTQFDDRIEQKSRGSRCGTPVSVADSLFESQEACPSSSKITGGSNPHRISYRKEIYKAVRRDDGYVWGKDYGLLSTAGDDDDWEL